MGVNTIRKIRDRNGKSRLIIIDEISMISPKLLAALSERLRLSESAGTINATLPFGGRHVVLMGDFFQLPPVGNGIPSIFKACVDRAMGKKSISASNIHGTALFQQFRRFNLTVQFRSKEDPEHTRRVARMRTSARPITDRFLKSLKMLTKKDVEEDSS